MNIKTVYTLCLYLLSHAAVTLTADEFSPAINSRVAILGYHEFSNNQKVTQMCLPAQTLRNHLEEINKQKLNIIDLNTFIQWKNGKITIPDKSVLITIDDGWISVYTEAFPVFKEFGIPFTVFLYSNYVDNGGKALTIKMIKEMQQSGLCSIGGHSASHPYPSKVKKMKQAGSSHYDKFLKKEFGESKVFLEKIFEQKITTYAYPGGFHTEEMYNIAHDLGYEHLFTVKPGKVEIDSPNHQLARYIVLGTHPESFSRAIRFKELPPHPSTKEAIIPETLLPKTQLPTSPAINSKVIERQPTIYVDMSSVTNLDEDKLELIISGFGKVPHTFDPKTKICAWKVNRPIRTNQVNVQLNWSILGEKSPEKPIKWSFLIDKSHSYLPK